MPIFLVGTFENRLQGRQHVASEESSDRIASLLDVLFDLCLVDRMPLVNATVMSPNLSVTKISLV